MSEETCEDLRQQLVEQKELAAIVQKGWDDCNRRNENTLVLLEAQKLLRKAVEKERDALRLCVEKVEAEVRAIEAELSRLQSRAAGVVSPLTIFWKEMSSVLKIKERIRNAVYECFPEVDPEAGAKSWVDTMLGELSILRSDLSDLATFVRRAPPHKRHGTVVLLPPEGFGGPRFLSQTVVTGGLGSHYGASGEEVTVPLMFDWPVNPGAWVIAHGCLLSEVFIGNKSQVRAPDANYCLTSDEVPLGARMQVRVRFET